MGLDIKQKIALAGLSIVAVFVLFIGLRTMRTTIYGEKPVEEVVDLSALNQDYDANANIEIKLTDTDNDGLTDWDEINVYNTSPYLPDSDSDGYLDGEEVEREDDPNCHNNKSCDGADAIQENVLITSEAEGNGISAQSNAELEAMLLQLQLEESELNNMKVDADELPDELKDITNPSDLRRALMSQGMDSEMLNLLNDEQLMQMYQKIIN